MAVMMPRERWTDERIDEAFDRVDGEIRELRVEMRRGFEQIDKRFERVDTEFREVRSEMKAGFERVDDRFDAVQRNMTTWAVALFSTIVTLNAAVIAAISLT
jgi:methyl-accepting chemotaxis protein